MRSKCGGSHIEERSHACKALRCKGSRGTSDRTFRAVPVADRDAAAMWRELRAAPLLTGYRGMPAMDTDALEQVLLRVARLAEECPEVSELDLNPVVAVPSGVAALDVKLKLQAVGDEPDAYVRELSFRRAQRPSE